MLLWIGFAVLTAVVVAVILRPLVVNAGVHGHATDDADLEVYRTQLDELDADVARGVIGVKEAEAARVEISRKILQVDARRQSLHGDKDSAASTIPIDPGTSMKRRNSAKFFGAPLAVLLAVLVPLSAIAVYVAVGAPNLPDTPHAARMTQDLKDASVSALLARVEAQLRANPEDGRGWEVVAPVYFRAGRFTDAADAYRNAARLLGATPERMIGYIKSAILANNGVVTDELKTLSQQLAEMVPDRPEPKFWLALAEEQDGNVEAARSAYEALLATATDQSPWREMVQRRLDGLNTDKATKNP